MKIFLPLLVFAFPFLGKSQKAILIDRNFFQPVQVVDSIAMEQVAMGLMPVYIQDVDSVLKGVEWLMTYINKDMPEVKGLLDLKAGQSRLTARIERNGLRKKYNIVLNTKFGSFETYVVIASNEFSKRALQRLGIFADYVRNNRPLAADLSSTP